MRINLGIDSKSIKSAINQIKIVKKNLPLMYDEFYYNCYLRFVEYCRNYLFFSTIGSEVASEIANGWQYERTITGAKFTNNTDKAVYVEFGVGIVGQNLSHVNANNLGNSYQYNIGAKIKEDGSWIFNVTDSSEIDIQQNFIENRTENTVKTKGSPAVMYAYNSLMDLQLELPTIWQEIKMKYLG